MERSYKKLKDKTRIFVDINQHHKDKLVTIANKEGMDLSDLIRTGLANYFRLGKIIYETGKVIDTKLFGRRSI